MSDYLKLSAAALAKYGDYKQHQADASNDRMDEYYRKCAGDMLAEAQAMAILAMAEAVVYPLITVTTERAENAELSRQRDSLKYALSAAADKIRRLTEDFCALEAQRNSLAAQVDDLRNVNAGLRASRVCNGSGSGGCDCLPDDED